MATPLPKIEQMTDILDLKEMVIWDLGWVWAILLIIVGFILIGLLTAYLKSRSNKKKTPLIILTPGECALERLNELVGRGLMEAGQIRQFFFILSEIYREFLESEIKVAASEATLEELRPLVKSIQDYTQEEIGEALWFLETCDMAKFAKYVPPKEDIIKSVKTCRVLITTLARRREIIREAAEAEKSKLESNEQHKIAAGN